MEQPTQARSGDPLAVAVANASLLGVGYLWLGRRRLALGTGLVTLVLVALSTWVVRAVWFEVVVLLWSAALAGHGWWLAGGRPRPVRRGQRVVALGLVLPVVLAVALVRDEAAGIEGAVADARLHGDCAQAVAAADRVTPAHRVADAPLTARTDDTVRACGILDAAAADLATGATGDLYALKNGFFGLGEVLAQLPGHERMVDGVLDGFVARLPAAKPCAAVAVTDWLASRSRSGNALDRSAEAVPRTAPAALLGCGDELLAGDEAADALTRYRQLLDRYPGHELTARAQEGVERATLGVELARIRALGAGYCGSPARYRGAPPPAKGLNRALVYGGAFSTRLPAEWKAADAAEAPLVVCAGASEGGSVARTCSYRYGIGRTTQVRFLRVAVPVKVYELRTGALVVDRKVEIGGASCPATIEYRTYGWGVGTDPGPSTTQIVTPTDADVHAAFRGLLTR